MSVLEQTRFVNNFHAFIDRMIGEMSDLNIYDEDDQEAMDDMFD